MVSAGRAGEKAATRRPDVGLAPGHIVPGVDDLRPPICPACGVTMVPAELSEVGARDEDWVCLECEETGGDLAARSEFA